MSTFSIGAFVGLFGICAHCGLKVEGQRVWCEGCLAKAARLRAMTERELRGACRCGNNGGGDCDYCIEREGRTA